MKTNIICSLVFLILFPAISIGQKQFLTSMTFQFSDEEGAFMGVDGTNPATDVLISYNKSLGFMQIDVNKIKQSWSYMQHWMSGAYSNSIIFNNRYLELRIKSKNAHDTGLSIRFLPYVACIDLCKKIPKVFYKIDSSNKWEIKFFNLEGSADTIFYQIAYDFPNDNYFVDYIYYGDAAVPPVPSIIQPDDQNVNPLVQQSLTLNGIEIPNRPYDGLVIKAEAKGQGILENIYFQDLGNGKIVDPFSKTATLHYTPVDSSAGKNDTIVITLEDTIRKTSKTVQFKVHLWGTSLETTDKSISLFPTLITNAFTIQLTSPTYANVIIMNTDGRVIQTRKYQEITSCMVDVGDLENGLYLVKIITENGEKTYKIIKE